jgi:hypothetical protein
MAPAGVAVAGFSAAAGVIAPGRSRLRVFGLVAGFLV